MSLAAANSSTSAGVIRVLVTNDAEHSSHDWADITASMIVEADIAASEEVRTAITSLKSDITKALVPVFEEVKADSPLLTISGLAKSATIRVQEISNRTKWGAHFVERHISEAIESLIRRNLNTVADTKVVMVE